MYPDVEEMVNYMATRYNVDVKSLYMYNDYMQGVFPRYNKMMGYMIKNTGGWPQVFPALGLKNVLVIGATGMVGSRINRVYIPVSTILSWSDRGLDFPLSRSGCCRR